MCVTPLSTKATPAEVRSIDLALNTSENPTMRYLIKSGHSGLLIFVFWCERSCRIKYYVCLNPRWGPPTVGTGGKIGLILDSSTGLEQVAAQLQLWSGLGAEARAELLPDPGRHGSSGWGEGMWPEGTGETAEWRGPAACSPSACPPCLPTHPLSPPSACPCKFLYFLFCEGPNILPEVST